MLDFISNLIHLIFGRNELRPYERVCLDAWKAKLDKDQKDKVERQLKEFSLIQRQANGTKSVFYDIHDPQYKKWSDDILLSDRALNKLAYSGRLAGKIEDIVLSVSFKIYLHRGRLFSIEFDSELGAMAKLTNNLEANDDV